MEKPSEAPDTEAGQCCWSLGGKGWQVKRISQPPSSRKLGRGVSSRLPEYVPLLESENRSKKSNFCLDLREEHFSAVFLNLLTCLCSHCLPMIVPKS